MKIVFVATVPRGLRTLRGAFRSLRRYGFEPILCCSPAPELEQLAADEGCRFKAIAIEREISLGRDLRSLVELCRFLRRERPTLVVGATPKGGLLAMLSGRLTGVPVRIQLKWGLRLETLTGVKRGVVWLADRLAASCATRILSDGASAAEQFVRLGLCRPEKIRTVAHGSANGLDAEQFSPNRENILAARALQKKYGIDPNDPVLGAVGRLVRDKGVTELFEVFKKFAAQYPTSRLMIIGGESSGDPLPASVLSALKSHPNVILPGHLENVVPYYLLFDLFVLPSYREGFPVVFLEAAAMGIPQVGFSVTGVRDAVRDGVTGTLVPPKNIDALYSAILAYRTDSERRVRHALAGRNRVVGDFSPDAVQRAYRAEVFELLRNKGISPPERFEESFSDRPARSEEEWAAESDRFLYWYAAARVVLHGDRPEAICRLLGLSAERSEKIRTEAAFLD